MAPDPTEIMIAKDGTIHTALLGVTLPAVTDPRASLDSDFNEVGYYSEDGVGLSNGLDLLEVMSDQSARPTRREAQTRNTGLTWAMQQWNAQNMILAYGGGRSHEAAAGVVVYDPPADGDALDEVSLILDWDDKGYEYRIIFERGNVTEGSESSLQRRAAAVLPVSFSVLDGVTLTNPDGKIVPWRFVTNDPAFAPVS